MKYWLEDDITISETASGVHILNMAGYSYLVKNYFRIYSIQGEYSHEFTPNSTEIRRFKQRVRDRCRQELSSPRTIYEVELMKGKYSAEMLVVLPTFYNMRK